MAGLVPFKEINLERYGFIHLIQHYLYSADLTTLRSLGQVNYEGKAKGQLNLR